MTMVLLRAQAQDADGIPVRLETLKVVSPVFDGILDSWVVDGRKRSADEAELEQTDARIAKKAHKGGKQAAARPEIVDLQPASKDAVNIITIGCTPEELVALVECISMTASGEKAVILGPDALLKHGACAMRCLVKYEANGVLRTLDLVLNCIIHEARFRPIVLEYLNARVVLLPDDAPTDAVSEQVLDFIATRAIESLRPVKGQRYHATTVAQSAQILQSARTLISSATSLHRFPRLIMAEILTRVLTHQ